MKASELKPFWCLMTYDQNGARMYACGPGGEYDPEHRYPSTIGSLTHRPHEARQFASRAEAEEARPLLAPWIARYVADWRQREKESKFAMMHPLTAHFEADLTHVYPDGSGLAREILQGNMRNLREEEEHIRTLRRFIQKHRDTLEGISWRCSHWIKDGPEITLAGPGFMAIRGVYVQPEELAALWPVEWRRKKPNYPDRDYLEYDWVAHLDDVQLRIPQAERTRIVPSGDEGAGTRVTISRESRKAVAR